MTEEVKRYEGRIEISQRYNVYENGYKYGIQVMDTDLEIFFGEDDQRKMYMTINGLEFNELPEVVVRR